MLKPIKGLVLVKVKALAAFTKTTRHGQFHGDPANAKTRTIMVPDYVVDELVKAKRIELAPAPAAKSAKPKPLSSEPRRDEYTMTHKGFGVYLIAGTGVPEGTEIKGKKDAQTYIEDMKAAVNAPHGPSGGDDAPID